MRELYLYLSDGADNRASEVLLITITIWGINIAGKFWADSSKVIIKLVRQHSWIWICYWYSIYFQNTNLAITLAELTLVPEVFLDFSSRKRSRASREAATTSRESDEEREKNLWLPWPPISLSCNRQGQDLTLGRWLDDIFSNTQTNLIGSFNCNYRGDAEDFHTSFCLSLPAKKIVCMLHSQ